MEKIIDRTSYRRNVSNEVQQITKGKNKKFSYINIFLNQIIVSLLIISVVLTMNYFGINFLNEWISEKMSSGYAVNEVVNMMKNIIALNNNDNQFESFSGDLEVTSGEVSGDISGEKIFMTAVEGVNQMLDDAEFIKEKFELIVPLKGMVTSEFGCRVSDSEIVSSYHTGLDIGAEKGTKIYSAHYRKSYNGKNFFFIWKMHYD